jgi:uncharacterized protein YjbJ (UPF0337 family)
MGMENSPERPVFAVVEDPAAARAAHLRMKHMGSTSDKVSGLANQAAGKIKEGVGKATGDAKLETEGAAQDAKGKVQKGIGDAKGAIKDAVNKNL